MYRCLAADDLAFLQGDRGSYTGYTSRYTSRRDGSPRH